jgi:hypothetical protein
MTLVEGVSVASIGTRSVGLSLAILVAAFFVVMRAGEYQSLGPLDLETADTLALALWVAAPIAGGLVVHRGTNGELARAARTLGLVVGLGVALFFLSGAGTGLYTCPIDPGAVPGGHLLGCLAVGALAGSGMSLGLLLVGVAARRPVTVLPGVALAGAATWAASAAAYELFYGAVRCLQ